MRRTLFATAMLCVAAVTPARADLVEDARAYLGKTAGQLGLPRSLWCADFMNRLLGRKHASRQAKSYAQYGRPASEGCIGCIVVLRRRGGAHVGVVERWHGKNPVVISGNHNHVVGEGEYPRSRVLALREP